MYGRRGVSQEVEGEELYKPFERVKKIVVANGS